MDHVPIVNSGSSQQDSVPISEPVMWTPISEPVMWTTKSAHDQAVRAATARNLSGRRRFIDPTTCERDYSKCEVEFMQAMQDYKKSSGRMFPTWCEVLEVLISLGYTKPNEGFSVGLES